jgi:hypothetical protein
MKLIKAWNLWAKFWFDPIDLFSVSLFRLIFGLSIFVMYSINMLSFTDFYTNSGYLPAEFAKMILPTFLNIPMVFYFVDATWALAAYILMMLLILLFTLGLIGRSLTWLLWALHLGFMQRNMGVVYGADLFSNFWLLYLSLVQHDRFFTLRKKMDLDSFSDPISSMGIRLIQIQLCISYAYTGIEKLKGTQWWEGTAVWYVLGMAELLPGDYTFMLKFPLIIGCLTIMTVLFEVYFPAAVWVPGFKYYWLLVGLVFHLSTALFMSLPFFCLVMTSAYVLFIDPKVVRKSWNLLGSYLKIS